MRPTLDSAWFAVCLYTILAVAMTWPLARGVTRDLPSDLGDSVLNCWILGWHAEHLLRGLSGDLSAFREVWNANIFYPSPLALAYSEHLFTQTVLVLPLYALSKNLILCYNLLFLASFVLSGLGMYLFAREVTGNARAAFVAGLVYGFVPYRVAQFPHLQVLSSQWMPFVLYGMRRYFETRRQLPLAGAGVAWIAQNLSCGYYVFFFAPFVALYALYEVSVRHLWTDARVLTALVLVAGVTAAATWPFMQPYLELRARGMFQPRDLTEVEGYSADLYAYLSAAPALRLWGERVVVFRRAEGELFPGFVPIVLAAIALAVHVFRTSRAVHDDAAALGQGFGDLTGDPVGERRSLRWGRRAVAWSRIALAIFFAYHVVIAITTVATGGFAWGFLSFRPERLGRAVWRVLYSGLLLLLLSPRGRNLLHRAFAPMVGFSALAATLGLWLSLGPRPTAIGGDFGLFGVYGWLYAYVPGFDGLRVPARFGMIVALFLAVLAAYGAVEMLRRRRGAGLLFALSVAFLIEANAAPIVINDVEYRRDVATPLNRLRTGAEIPPAYRFLRTLPPDTAILELPFGVWVHELQYMYYSTVHLKPLVNGYSGWFPPSYDALRDPLSRLDRRGPVGWRTIMGTGATHVLLHEGLYLGRAGERVAALLERRGAREIARFGSDHVYELPRAGPHGGRRTNRRTDRR